MTAPATAAPLPWHQREDTWAILIALGCEPGQPAKDPKLLALWLCATSEAVGGARHLSRLCERDAPYRWLCGGVASGRFAGSTAASS